MASRTNKMWILKQKKQAEKLKKLVGSSSSNLDWQKKDYENPKWNVYTWFFRSWKLICDKTSAREDPDGYRAIRKANSWEVYFVYKWADSWAYRRYLKKMRKFN